MGARTALAGWLAAVGLLALSSAAWGDGAAVVAPRLPLAHAGRFVTDAQGRVVTLHGLNEVQKFPPYEPSATGFGDKDAAFLAANGFNAIRVGVIYKAVEPQPGVYDDAYLARIAATVDTLARHGIVSLLDFHQDQFNERFQGEGFPDWAVQTDGLPAAPQLGFPLNYVAQPATQRAFDHFWQNSPAADGVGLQDHFARAWAHVAARFRADPAVAGYELLNEPWPGTLWQQCALPLGCPLFDSQLTTFVKRVDSAIRAADPWTLVWYEPNVLFNDGADTRLGAIGDAHAGFAFHDYCLAQSETGTYTGCDPFDDLVFANAEKRVAATGDALLMTEFGSTDNASTLLAMVQRADRNMVGWLEWAYTGNDPTSSNASGQSLVIDPAKAPSGANVKLAKLKLLGRPYPEIVAGTPRDFGFADSTATLTADWTTARANGGSAFGAYSESDIAVPGEQYPAGYRVQVSGGTVLSLASAAALRIGSCPGAEAVHLVVLPGSGVAESCPPPRSSPAGHARRLRSRRSLRVSVRPRRLRAGIGARLVVLVRTLRGRSLNPVRGALVRVGAKHARTDRHGIAVLGVRGRRSGRIAVVVQRSGFRSVRVVLRVANAQDDADA